VKLLRAAAVLLVLLVLASALLAAWLVYPYQGFRGEAFLDIPKGTGTRRIATLLAKAGVIRHPLQFLAIRAVRPGARLQAGEYRFDRAASAWDVFDRIARGDVFFYTLAVPEGYNIFDIASALAGLGIMDADSFLAAARDTSVIHDLDVEAPTLEGFLFPDTYRITHNTPPVKLVRQMTDRFRRAWQELGPPAADVHDTVTLASLIEKEARVRGERPLIAAVFVNRLRAGMPLQCDPTTIYAALLEDRYRGTIFRSDLESRSRYNTYQHAGLPPGPIANPGLESLRAALNPAASKYLYFVARPDGSGAHQFSERLAEHERAVQQYRRGLKANGAATLDRRAPPAGRRRSGVGGTAFAPRPGQ
jgi:UPF0755 protein